MNKDSDSLTASPAPLHFFFLHLLTQDSPKVRAELPLLVQISGSGIPNEGIYSDLSGINSVDVDEEDQSRCPYSESEPTTTPKNHLGSGNWPKNCPWYELLGDYCNLIWC